MHDKVEPVDGYVFLFSDLLLVTRERTGGVLTKDGYQLKVACELATARIVNVGDTESRSNAMEIFYQVEEKKKKFVERSVLLCASSPAEKRMWLQELKDLKKEFQKKALLLRSAGKG